MPLLETARLYMRELNPDDAAFVLELLNQPSFIRFIADRGVRRLDDARRYIENVPIASYQKHGFGLYRVALKDSDTPIGMFGFIKRDFLDDVDIGYAMLERFWGQGYAYEAASALMDYGRKTLELKRVVAIVSPDNDASIHLLEKLGLRYERMITMPGEDEEIKFFGTPR